MAISAEYPNFVSPPRITEPAPTLRLQQLIDNGAVYVARNLSPAQFATLQAIAALILRPKSKRLAARIDHALASSASEALPLRPTTACRRRLSARPRRARHHRPHPHRLRLRRASHGNPGRYPRPDHHPRSHHQKARPRPLARRTAPQRSHSLANSRFAGFSESPFVFTESRPVADPSQSDSPQESETTVHPAHLD